MQSMIRVISLSSVSSYTSTLVSIQQQLINRIDWLINSSLIVKESFEQVLGNYSNLYDIVNI